MPNLQERATDNIMRAIIMSIDKSCLEWIFYPICDREEASNLN